MTGLPPVEAPGSWEINMHKHTFLSVVLGVIMLGASGLAAACELGRAQYNAAGEQQITVNDNGQQVGMVSQGRDGRWEAVVENQGALNQRYPSFRAAAHAVCEAAEG